MKITGIVIRVNASSAQTLNALHVGGLRRRSSLIFAGTAIPHQIDHLLSQAHSHFTVVARHINCADHIGGGERLAVIANFQLNQQVGGCSDCLSIQENRLPCGGCGRRVLNSPAIENNLT